MRANVIELAILDQLFYFDESFTLRHKQSRSGVTLDSKVGHISKNGYLKTEYKNKTYSVSRIAYQMYHRLPILDSDIEIDHIDCNKLNNHPSNLRIASAKENSRNRPIRKDNRYGLKGITFDKNKPNPWRARIRVNNVLISLGSFKDKESAHSAYAEASKKYHLSFGRTI